MKNIAKVTRIWFLDWFGCLLDYKQGQGLVRLPFKPGIMPDCFDVALWPVRVPSRMRLRQKDFLPTDLPPMETFDVCKGPVDHAKAGTIALRSLESNTYLTSNHYNNEATFSAYEAREWEFLLPLNAEALLGLSRLLSEKMSEIKDDDGHAPLRHGLQEGHNFQFDDHRFSILDNLEMIIALGSLKAGETVDISCKFHEGQEKAFKVTIL